MNIREKLAWGTAALALGLGYGEIQKKAGYERGHAQGVEETTQRMQPQQDALAEKLEDTEEKLAETERLKGLLRQAWKESGTELRAKLEEAQSGVCNTTTEAELVSVRAGNQLAIAQLAELYLGVSPDDRNATIDGIEHLDCPAAYAEKRREAREWAAANRRAIAEKTVEVCASDQIPRKEVCPASVEAAEHAIEEALALEVADKCSSFVSRELANAKGHTADGIPIVRYYPDGFIHTPDGEDRPWLIDKVDPRDLAGRELHERLHWTTGLRHKYGADDRILHDAVYAYGVAATLVRLEEDGRALRVLTNGDHWFDFTGAIQ